MIKIQLEEDIYLYQFEEEPKSLIGLNICIIYDGSRFVMIDCGYAENIEELKKELDFTKCDMIINTHLHPDHILGKSVLPKIPTIGSHRGVETLRSFQLTDEELKIYQPNIEYQDEYRYQFGRHTFILKTNPGHSICGSIILLNNHYLFIGDDLMFTNDGLQVAPYFTQSNFIQIEQAINRIEEHMSHKMIIPAHGKPIYDTQAMQNHIHKIRSYIHKLKNRQECQEMFDGHPNCHPNNLKKIEEFLQSL